MMDRRLAIGRSILIAVIFAATSAYAPTAAQSAPATAATDPASDQCTPLPIQSTSYLTPSGSVDLAQGPEDAVVYHYAFEPGDDIEQIVPPLDLNPLSASNDLLDRFGLPERPDTNSPRLQQWLTEFSNWHGVEWHQMCVRDRSHAQLTRYNWAGVEDGYHSDYRRADGEVRIPDANQAGILCSQAQNSGEDLALWAGLGGDGTARLLQDGEDTHDSTHASGMNAWWQAISSSYDTKQVVVDQSFAAVGDLVENYTYLDSANSRVIYNWYDITNGNILTPVTAQTIHGQPINQYYDGTTAEFIDERSERPNNGGYYNLAYFPVHGWANATTARAGQSDVAVRVQDHDTLTMKSEVTGDLLADIYGATFSNDEGWNMQWHNTC